MATKAKKTQDKYKPNQFVVHPHHGAAKIIRKVNKNVEILIEGEPKSKRIEYYEIEVLLDGLIVSVPVENVDEVLKIALKKELKKVEWTEVENISKTSKEQKSQASIQ